MKERTIANRIVKGTKGIAEFALEHIEDLRNGCSIDFAAWCPEEETEDINQFRSGCNTWYGIVRTNALEHFGNEYDCLVMDYYGGDIDAQIFVYDPEYTEAENLAQKIATMLDNQGWGVEDDELVYVECMAREATNG